MDGEECNELESERDKAAVEETISIEEEMVVDNGRKILAVYMRGYSQSPPSCYTPTVKEVSEDPSLLNLTNLDDGSN